MIAAVTAGPAPTSRAARAALVVTVAARVARAEGAALECVALYGSMARGEDGPHSDVEMIASVRGRDDHRVDEWLAPAGKVKVHRYGARRLRSLASAVGPEWPLERGKWLQLVTILGDDAVAEELRARSAAVADDALHAAARALWVAELYELVGKARNADHAGDLSALPAVAIRFAEQAALWVALVDRAPYTSRHRMLAEALARNGSHAGLRALFERALRGDLAASASLLADLEGAWGDLADRASRIDVASCRTSSLAEGSP